MVVIIHGFFIVAILIIDSIINFVLISYSIVTK